MSVDVDAVVLAWNSARFLPGCLDSLAAQSHPGLRVMVADNGSSDGSADLVARRYPGVRLLRFEQNLGFCRANNRALARCRAPFLLFLNADTILDSAFVPEALPGFTRNPRVGMVSGKILRFDRRTVDSAGQFLARNRRTLERGYGQPDGPRFGREGPVFSVCGAAAFYRREMVDDIAPEGRLFDPGFFSFHEDLDVGWRAQNAGWRAWYRPTAVAYHFRGGSGEHHGIFSRTFQIARRPPEVVRHIVLNRYRSIIRNDRLAHYLRDAPAILLRDVLTLVLVAACTPSVLPHLLRSRGMVREARARRREDSRRRGRWGPVRRGLPRPGIWPVAGEAL